MRFSEISQSGILLQGRSLIHGSSNQGLSLLRDFLGTNRHQKKRKKMKIGAMSSASHAVWPVQEWHGPSSRLVRKAKTSHMVGKKEIIRRVVEYETMVCYFAISEIWGREDSQCRSCLGDGARA